MTTKLQELDHICSHHAVDAHLADKQVPSTTCTLASSLDIEFAVRQTRTISADILNNSLDQPEYQKS